MDPRNVVALPPQSPWSAWARPDIKHCEANLAGWVAAPADVWSNLAYVLAAAWLWRRRREPGARALAGIALAIGATSALFHASYTFFFQLFDYGGMFLCSAWILSLDLRRLGRLDARGARAFGAALFAASVTAVAAFHRRGWPVQPLFGVQLLAIVGLEARLFLSRREAVDRRPLLVALALVAAGFAFWNLDHADWFCRADDHVFQGHALWHLLTAASFAPAFFYYRQFAGDPSARAG